MSFQQISQKNNNKSNSVQDLYIQGQAKTSDTSLINQQIQRPVEERKDVIIQRIINQKSLFESSTHSMEFKNIQKQGEQDIECDYSRELENESFQKLNNKIINESLQDFDNQIQNNKVKFSSQIVQQNRNYDNHNDDEQNQNYKIHKTEENDNKSQYKRKTIENNNILKEKYRNSHVNFDVVRSLKSEKVRTQSLYEKQKTMGLDYKNRESRGRQGIFFKTSNGSSYNDVQEPQNYEQQKKKIDKYKQKIEKIFQLKQTEMMVKAWIIPKIRDFIPLVRIKHIGTEQLMLLNDKTANYKFHLKHNFLFSKKLKQNSVKNNNFLGSMKQTYSQKQNGISIFTIIKIKIKKLITQIQVINPDNKWIIALDIMSLFIIISWIFLFCTHLAFEHDFDNSIYLDQYRNFTIVYSIIEILLRFNIGIYQKGNIIVKRKYIALHYLYSNFFADFLGLSVLLYNLAYTEMNYTTFGIELLYFAKYKTLKTLVYNIQYRDQLYSEQSHLKELLLMLLEIFILCHWLATIWHFVALLEIHFGEENTWIHQNQILQEGWIIRYISSYYSALSTALLIGSIAPTPIEQVVIIIFLFGTVGVFAYFLSSISLIIQEINKKQSEHKNDMELINTYMRQNNIERSTQSKIRRYLEFYNQDRSQMQLNIQVGQVLSKLPKQLNNEIITEINFKLIQKLEQFKKNFSSKSLHKLSKISKEQTYVTNDIIVESKGEDSEPALYIINHGEVEICFKNEANTKIHPIKVLRKGDIFGEFDFITGKGHTMFARSISFATVLKVRRKDYLKVLRKNQDDYEKFLYIKDQLLQSGLSSKYRKFCNICGSNMHSESKCNLLQVRPNRQLVIYKFLKKLNYNQPRQRYLRPRKKMNVYTILDDLIETSKQILDNYHKFQAFVDEQDQIYQFNIDKYGFLENEIQQMQSQNTVYQNQVHQANCYSDQNVIPTQMLQQYYSKINNQNNKTQIQSQFSNFQESDEDSESGTSDYEDSNIQMEESQQINTPSYKKSKRNSQNSQKVYQQSSYKTGLTMKKGVSSVNEQNKMTSHNGSTLDIQNTVNSPKNINKGGIYNTQKLQKTQTFVKQAQQKPAYQFTQRSSLQYQITSQFQQKQQEQYQQQLSEQINKMHMGNSQQNQIRQEGTKQRLSFEDPKNNFINALSPLNNIGNKWQQQDTIFFNDKGIQNQKTINNSYTNTYKDYQFERQKTANNQLALFEFDMKEKGYNFKIYFPKFNMDQTLVKLWNIQNKYLEAKKNGDKELKSMFQNKYKTQIIDQDQNNSKNNSDSSEFS